MLTGPVPEPAQRAPLTAQSLADQFAKTGGTPYYSTGTDSRIDLGLVPSGGRRQRPCAAGSSPVWKDERAALPERRSAQAAAAAAGGKRYYADPVLIVQVHQAEQLTPELAQLCPAYVYVLSKF